MAVTVRYICDDVEASATFYENHLGFAVEAAVGGDFAALSRGELRLLLNRPGAGGAGQPTPDGRWPSPGGWNRIQIEVDDLAERAVALRAAGVNLRSDVVTGHGGSQLLLDDPDGNPVELMQRVSR
jgi:catechol 2,3-dioxygenase-like lactoylglutathione lyase family enzyme